MKTVRGVRVGDAGTELRADFSQNSQQTAASAAKSGAIPIDSIAVDPDLATVEAAWPTLPKATRRASPADEYSALLMVT
jgi:hypothetical protein